MDPQYRSLVALKPIVLAISRFLTSPILSGFVSMIVRNAPWESLYDVKESLQEGIRKELEAAQDVYHPKCLDWEAITSKDRSYRSSHMLNPEHALNPSLNHEIHFALVSSFEKLSTRVLYPDYSRKTIGVEAVRNIRAGAWLRGTDFEEESGTTLGLELIYHQFGVVVPGPTEVRWSWMYGILKPRVYYARGPDQYYSSRYIQAIFNVLVDSLPTTHRFQRFFTSHIHGDDTQMAVIYDYSSFTSKFFECRCFILSLARLARGYKVLIIDTFLGPITKDLGDMFEEYYEACCNYPSFDATRLCGDLLQDDILLLIHNCGMLGVPGNISSCTLGHGIHLASAVGSTINCRVVGDDASGMIERMTRSMLKDVTSPIGVIAEEKFVIWNEEEEHELEETQRWHYTKRPVEFYQNSFFVGKQVVWPSIASAFGWVDDFHTVHPAKDEYTRIKKVSSSLLSFAMQFRYFEPTEEEIGFAERFIRIVYEESVESSPLYQALHREFVVPRSLGGAGVMSELTSQYWNSVVRLPDFEERGAPDQIVRGMWFESKMSKAVGLARDLGYATVEPKFRDILVREESSYFERWISKDFRPIYDINVYDTVPGWLWSLVKQSVLSYDPDDDAPYVGVSSDSDDEVDTT